MTATPLDIADPRVLALLQKLPLAIAAVGGDGKVIFINEYASRQSAYTVANTPTLTAWREKAFPDVEYRRQVTSSWDAAVAQSQLTDAAIQPRDIEFVVGSGRTRHASVFGIPLNGGFLAAFVDNTDRLHYETQLREAQKLQAVSTLAGGIAHEFNNLLAVMLMQLETAHAAAETPNSWLEPMEDLKAALLQAQRLIGSLLDFAGRRAVNAGPTTLAAIVTDVVRLVRPSLPSGVEIVSNVDAADDSSLHADRSQVTQLGLNLLLNAIDAMQSRRGAIRVHVESVQLTAGMAPLPIGLKSGVYRCLSVADEGNGIEPKYIERVFEPFFTTKPSGRGVGLGLAVARGIAQAHRGFITVDSTIGRGSTFKVCLPVAWKT